MISWARRHIPEALLVPAALGAGAVTALSDIDEVVPWGHELGVGVSQLAFAYVGAYIFNWLIVERPRSKALREYYRAAWPTLLSFANLPERLVYRLHQLAGRQEPVGYEWADLQQTVASISSELEDGRVLEIFTEVANDHREEYEGLIPILNQLEPSVAVKIAALNAAPMRQLLEMIKDQKFAQTYLPHPMSHRILSGELHRYHQAGRALLSALLDSRHTPWTSDERKILREILNNPTGEGT